MDATLLNYLRLQREINEKQREIKQLRSQFESFSRELVKDMSMNNEKTIKFKFTDDESKKRLGGSGWVELRARRVYEKWSTDLLSRLIEDYFRSELGDSRNVELVRNNAKQCAQFIWDHREHDQVSYLARIDEELVKEQREKRKIARAVDILKKAQADSDDDETFD